ncbi:hypothetical protein [Zoogloea dura]|uniref:Uncharacterized protein n=1 Tax=Zoogloea dura TaxID=2728840 RepID=A0A848G7S2_9RHOO|nr:hypothetical protein [Zoogloea dura]NML27449.1 hypothetical protein [Zoogloea dura]
MLESEDKTTALLVKLNRLTSLDKIVWQVTDPPRTLARGTDDVIPFFMYATHKGKHFGLFQQRYQSYDGEHERFYWSEQVVLAILDYDGRVLWETSSYSSALADLFETARRKVANVDGLIEDLLGDDEEEI